MSRASQYDFDFDSDTSNRLLPFIMSFLFFTACMAIISCIFTYDLTRRWSNSLNGKLSIEIQAVTTGDNTNSSDACLTANQIDEIIKIVQDTPGVKSVKRLQDEDMLKILEPWLNVTAIPDDFPFPIILDVQTNEKCKIDLLGLTEKISRVTSNVRIHDHANWYAALERVSNGLFLFAFLLTGFVLFTVCAVVIFITRKNLMVHKNVIKILQMVGARNNYIAAQFKNYYFSIGCKASIITFVLGLLIIFMVNVVSGTSWYSMLCLAYICALLLVPFAMTFIVMFTTRRAVLFFLDNDNWVG